MLNFLPSFVENWKYNQIQNQLEIIDAVPVDSVNSSLFLSFVRLLSFPFHFVLFDLSVNSWDYYRIEIHFVTVCYAHKMLCSSHIPCDFTYIENCMLQHIVRIPIMCTCLNRCGRITSSWWFLFKLVQKMNNIDTKTAVGVKYAPNR